MNNEIYELPSFIDLGSDELNQVLVDNLSDGLPYHQAKKEALRLYSYSN